MSRFPFLCCFCGGGHAHAFAELRKQHAEGQKYAGINVRKGTISDLKEEGVEQPLLVSISALTLATETVRMILKCDDYVMGR